VGRVGLRAAAPALRMLRETVPRAAPELPFTVREGAAAVYMPSCVSRIIGNSPPRAARPSVPQALVALSLRVGLPLWIPGDVAGHCCGMPWSSKGLRQGHTAMAAKTAEALRRWSDDGRLPIVIDASSCTHGLLEDEPPGGVEVLDSIAWVHGHLLERLEISHKLSRVTLHPTCSVRHLGLTGELSAIASRIADEVVVPAGSGCCGMAGDRGLERPELLRSALRDMICELEGREFDACLSSNRTCEIGMQQTTGRPYASFLISLEELTRP
jgi:D-lactate dehydrogenase